MLYVQRTSGGEEYDSNGDRIPPAAEWVYHCPCREETNGKGEVIVTADRKEYRFHSLVQIPRGIQPIPQGTAIKVLEPMGRIIEEDYVRLSGTCAKFDPGKLHCRMWV